MVKLKELRKIAAAELRLCQNDSPLADADYILKSLGYNKTELLIGEKTVPEQTEQEFYRALNRLKNGEPVQYIVGECEFMSLKFRVDSSTLIPRADTEILVEAVLERVDAKSSARILEIGSGSGCIAVSLAKYLPLATVTAVDISQSAIKVASQNAKDNGVDDRVTFFQCDIIKDFEQISGSFDAVVSNPPYIPQCDIDRLDKKVKDFEPLTALIGGEDGLDFYRHITEIASLKDGGFLAFEVGINQAQDVKALLKGNDFEKTEILKDLSGIERVVLGYKKEM